MSKKSHKVNTKLVSLRGGMDREGRVKFFFLSFFFLRERKRALK